MFAACRSTTAEFWLKNCEFLALHRASGAQSLWQKIPKLSGRTTRLIRGGAVVGCRPRATIATPINGQKEWGTIFGDPMHLEDCSRMPTGQNLWSGTRRHCQRKLVGASFAQAWRTYSNLEPSCISPANGCGASLRKLRGLIGCSSPSGPKMYCGW